MEEYFKERPIIFNRGSEFSCPDSCERYGCKEPSLHISIGLVDLAALSFVSGHKVFDLFENFCKIGFDPLREGNPWIGRISIELKKPCPFLAGKECGVYPGRPIACALFPESLFVVEEPESFRKKEIFRNFSCIQNPSVVSPRRKEVLRHLMEMSLRETFLSDFYLFGISPFVIDLKNIAGEGLEGIVLSGDGKARIPHCWIEDLVFQRLVGGESWAEWDAKIKRLDTKEGLDGMMRLKEWTDQMAAAPDRSLSQVAYQFDGSRLLPIHLCK